MASVSASHNWLALGQLFKSVTFTFFSKELLGDLQVIGCVKVLYKVLCKFSGLSILIIKQLYSVEELSSSRYQVRYEDTCPPTVLIAGEGSEEGMIGLERWNRLGGRFLIVSHVALASLSIFTLNKDTRGQNLDGVSFDSFSSCFYAKC